VRLPAWFDDGPVDPAAPAITLLDAGLRSGLGVFETLRAHGAATLALDRHLARLVDSARRIGIAADGPRVEAAIILTLTAPRDVAEVAVRITLTAGPVTTDAWPAAPTGRPALGITLHPAPSLPLPAVSAATVAARRWPADIKTTSYLASVLAQRAALERGADVAVLVDGDELLETAEGNLIAIVDGALVTPPADGRLLPGVTRGLVLEEGAALGLDVRLEPVRRDVVARADALLMTSSVGGIRTVRTLDGEPVGGSGDGGRPHPTVLALRTALESRRA